MHIQTVQRGLLEHPAASRVFRSASEHVVVTVTRPETWRSAKNCKYRHSLGFVCHSAGEINTIHNKHYGVLELAYVYVGDAGHICMMKESSQWRVIVVVQMHQMADATVPMVSIKGLNLMVNYFSFDRTFFFFCFQPDINYKLALLIWSPYT